MVDLSDRCVHVHIPEPTNPGYPHAIAAGYGNVTPLQSGACVAAFFATLLGICVVSLFVSVLAKLVDGNGSGARSCSLCKSRRRFSKPAVVPVEAARVDENNERGSDANSNELASRAGSRPGLSVCVMCILENLAISLALLSMIGSFSLDVLTIFVFLCLFLPARNLPLKIHFRCSVT